MSDEPTRSTSSASTTSACTNSTPIHVYYPLPPPINIYQTDHNHTHQHHYHDHYLPGINQKLTDLLERIEHMSEFTDNILREVRETRGVVDSAIAAFSRIANEIRENLDDREALESVANELDSIQSDLAAGVASVPTAPEPTPAPEPVPVVEPEPTSGEPVVEPVPETHIG